MITFDTIQDRTPRWLLAIGPVVILAVMLLALFITSPFGDGLEMTDAETGEVLWMLTIIGFMAGIVPVMTGMLWYPFLSSLGKSGIHAILALSAGVLVFVAVEMTEGIVDFSAEVDGLATAVSVAFIGVIGTFAIMELISDWHHDRVSQKGRGRGLAIAYIVAIGLGAHSIGEGIAIGSAFVLGEVALVTLLVIGFIAHNVSEGPVIVAAVANEATTPPIRHFLLMGVIAGGPVIIGGWIGSLAGTGVLAVLFFAIGLGAIVQVLYEVTKYIKGDQAKLTDRLNIAAFLVGFVVMLFLEEVVLAEFII